MLGPILRIVQVEHDHMASVAGHACVRWEEVSVVVGGEEGNE